MTSTTTRAILAVALAEILLTQASLAQDPVLRAWRRNLDGTVGSGGDLMLVDLLDDFEADVQHTKYDASQVYVQSTGIPSHTIGPWEGNPNLPDDMGWSFRIPRDPTPAALAHAPTELGPIAVMVNGVPIFNAKDGKSYGGMGVWNQNAVYWEQPDMDAGYGHPDSGEVYHYHQQPPLLRAQEGDNGIDHSPILGFAFDGYPIYGPYGFANSDGTGGVRRIETSYRERDIHVRHALPEGGMLPPIKWGPDVSDEFPIGAYLEDFEYVEDLGDLDQHNGRECVTPEYPDGTYAYFATVGADGASAYPYSVGPTYYGEPDAANIGMGGGHVAVPADADEHAPFELYENSLYGGQVATGAPLKISTANVPPNSTVVYAASLAGKGPLPTGFGTIALSMPIVVLGAYKADAAGELTKSYFVGTSLAGTTLYTQAAVITGAGIVLSLPDRVVIQ